MSMLEKDMYAPMVQDVVDNLKNEIVELSTKVSKARELGNWGTYKNLILAYKEIVRMYNDIAIDVCKSETNDTQHVKTEIALDRGTSNLILDLMEKNSKDKNRENGVIRLISEYDYYGINVNKEEDSLVFKADMGIVLHNKLMQGKRHRKLIDVTGFRAIGKTYSLIKFAKEYGYTVIVPDGAENFKTVYDYDNIYEDSDNLDGIAKCDCVVDEGVDIDELASNPSITIITGYVRK